MSGCRQELLFVFAQAHAEFRIPEIESVAGIYGFSVDLPTDYDVSRPFMVLSMTEEQARLLARRCILIKSVHHFYARATSYEELHKRTKEKECLWAQYVPNTSFKFEVRAYNHTIPKRRQRDVIESFSFMDFQGLIDMTNPEIIMNVFEEYPDRSGTTRHVHEGDGEFIEVFFGRLIEDGSARPLIHTFDVKKRAYFGNTSMEAEISLLMANQTLASPGKMIYDPFAGTGSMLYTTAYFGALVFGSDIDGRQMRGKDTSSLGIRRAAQQYGVEARLGDLLTFDVTQNPLRCGSLFDAILTDPPYGVRAGAKRIGRKVPRETPTSPREGMPYVPPTMPYELSALAVDLVLLARYLLKPGGRLVFFLPTVTDEYAELDVQAMLCEGMVVIANSLQDFGTWGRRLITVKKVTTEVYPRPVFKSNGSDSRKQQTTAHVPAHRDFREKYFQGFRKDGPIGEDGGAVVVQVEP